MITWPQLALWVQAALQAALCSKIPALAFQWIRNMVLSLNWAKENFFSYTTEKALTWSAINEKAQWFKIKHVIIKNLSLNNISIYGTEPCAIKKASFHDIEFLKRVTELNLQWNVKFTGFIYIIIIIIIEL